MPTPSAAVFDRLRALAAITDISVAPVADRRGGFHRVAAGHHPGRHRRGRRKRPSSKPAPPRVDWSNRPVADRIEVIERYRDLVVERTSDFLMDLLQAEAGKARWAAQEEMIDLIANANYYARVSADLLKPHNVQSLLPGIGKTTVRHQPKGRGRGDLPVELSDDVTASGLGAGASPVTRWYSNRTARPTARWPAPSCSTKPACRVRLYAVVPGPGSVVGTAILENC